MKGIITCCNYIYYHLSQLCDIQQQQMYNDPSSRTAWVSWHQNSQKH